jgi:uncharacterized membrane protein
MDQMPEFWRTEVWHPLSVHFPVALLLVASLFKIIALFIDGELWNRGGSILLYLGTIGAWVSVYTGDMADGTVSRTLCDPTILKDHENAAYITGWIFSAAILVDVVAWIDLIAIKRVFLQLLMVILLLVGSGYLIYVGHTGASLVYQQGAGVYKPTEDCQEFE